MNKLMKYRLSLAAALLLGLAVIVLAGVKKNVLLAIIAFLVMGLWGAVLSARYKIEIYRIIGAESPGAYDRIIREGEFPDKSSPPLPEDVQMMLKRNRRFQRLAAWLPILEMILFFAVQVLLRET